MKKNLNSRRRGGCARAHKRRREWQILTACLAVMVIFGTVSSLTLPAIAQEDIVPVETALKETNPEESAPEESVPVETAPEESVPVESAPVESAPVESAPVESDPEETAAEDTDLEVPAGEEPEEPAEAVTGEEPEEPVFCGKEEHLHDEGCRDESGALTCGLEEHTHSPACYSNPGADIENEDIWKQTFAGVELTGDYRGDLLAIAGTQLGYAESGANFRVLEDGTVNGYTRYGAWYGGADFAYEDWCAMFVSFCLHYAGVPAEAFPPESGTQTWIEKLAGRTEGYEGYDLYREAAAYTPAEGDLVFYDQDGDGLADHVGIVSGPVYGEIPTEETVTEETIAEETVTEETPAEETAAAETIAEEIVTEETQAEEALTGFTAIEGNLYDRVMEVPHAFTDPAILGYGVLPTGGAGLAALDGAYLSVADFGLCAYRCVYGDTDGALSVINGYGSRQLIPGEGKAMENNPSRFRMEGVYTCTDIDNTKYYLLPVDSLKTIFPDYDGATDRPCPFVYATQGGTNPTFLADYVEMSGEETETGQSAWYVRIGANGGGDYPVGYLYLAAAPEQKTDMVSSSSTVIHLFDYWTTENRFDDDNHKSTNTDLNGGINQDHALKFGKNIGNGYGLLNYSQGGTGTPSKVTQGIVANKLGADSFPALSGNTALGMEATQTESLAYLFDPETEAAGKVSFANVKGLLTRNSKGYYSYDASQNAAQLDEETNTFSVYTMPSGGYGTGSTAVGGQFFPFNDVRQTALLTADRSPFNHYFGLAMTSRFIQQHDGYTTAARTTPMTFTFSGDNDVWIFIDDVLVADLGGLRSAASVTINFSDGKVTINDKGVTGNDTGTPNTTLREAFVAADKYNEEDWNFITDEDGNPTREATFKDNTTHTLKFFYLERGNYDSNLNLEYNLNEIPPTSIYKVNQYGGALGGATFAVYAAAVDGDEDTGTWTYTAADRTPVEIPQNAEGVTYNTTTWDMTYNGQTFRALYAGVTDSRGEMVFLDADGMPYSLSELEKMFGSHFILREVDVPEGYRTVSDDTYLYIEGGLLQTADPYGTGVWASPNALITATNTLYVASTSEGAAKTLMDNNSPYVGKDASTGRYTIDYYNPSSGSNGTLFAVVLKRNGADERAEALGDLNLSAWSPVYGNEDKGYEVLNPGADGNLAQAIQAAKANAGTEYNQDVTFSVAASGMQLLMENLPGKPERYYSYVLNQGESGTVDASEPQYVVAYYWTTETITGQEDWDRVNPTNTVRVASHENTTPVSDSGFDVQWGSTIQVPNVLNRLFFQKKNEAGELVNNAVFALYNVEEHAIKNATEADEKLIYYVGHGANDTDAAKYWVALLDSDGSAANAGKAAVFREKEDGSAERVGYGTYTVNTQGWAAITEGTHAGRVSGTNIGRVTVTVTHSDSGYTTAISEDEKVTVYVDPAVDVHDNYPLVGYTHNSCSVVSEDGTGHLTYLDEGCYYLREIAAPVGYALNTASVPVYIDSTGVYANAGTKENGVAVGNGVGYLVATMNTFASQGKIDESLTWVYGALIVNRAKDFSAFADDTGDTLTVSGTAWSFAKQEADDKPSHASGTVEPSNDSAARREAMVTYLVYTGDRENEPEDIFDYSPNDIQSARTGVVDSYGNAADPPPNAWVPTLDGQGDRRLYTTIGWSDLAIYQDYAHGYKQFTTDSTTNYDDLTGKGNLANLFSSSTFVEVTDPGWVDLELVKTESGTDRKLTGAEFRLRKDVTTQVSTEGGNGETVYEEKVTPYYYRRAGSETTWAESAQQATVIYPGSETQPTVFYDLPIGTYALEECKAPDGYYPLTGTIRITVTDPTSASGVTVDANNTGAALSGTVILVNDKHAVVPDGSTSGQGLHYQYTLTVPNSTGYELPATGGGGTAALSLPGAVLVIGAGLPLAVKRRRSAAKQ